jgi:REP-associated tyrosine transposase
MLTFIRSKKRGGTFFFTIITYRRRKILTIPESINILHEVISEVRREHPFFIDAWVLLPDHMHSIWTLPKGDDDYSRRWGLIKARFSRSARTLFHLDDLMTDSKEHHRESTIWQRRFWEHQIRDERDLNAPLDYLHYNPVKHGMVANVAEWPYSTFHRYVEQGLYPANWGENISIESDNIYGE